MSFVFLLSCREENTCITKADITEQWFEINSTLYSFDNCYLLSSDGHILEKNQETQWLIGDWYLIDYSSPCVYEIGLGAEDSMLFINANDDCLEVQYNDKIDAEICECPY